MKPLMGIQTAAAAVGMSTRHFYRKVTDTGLRVTQIGRRFFITRSDLLKWAAEQGLQVRAK